MTNEKLATLFLDTVPRAMWIIRTEMRTIASMKPNRKISVSQFRALAHLYGQPRTNRALAERQGVNFTTMSRNLDVLVKRGWVIRSASSQDKRQVQVELSSKGRREYERMQKMARKKFSGQIGKLRSESKKNLRKGFDVLQTLIHLSQGNS